MKRVMLTVAYDGTRYHGWQLQANGVTIEEELNRALGGLLSVPVQVVGASRTDAGVHALGNVAVFDTDSPIPGDKFAYALNQRLPEDIRIRGSKEVPPDFHPRKTVSEKTYAYRILNEPFPNPVDRLYTYHVYLPLDVPAMQAAAEHVIGEHDFASFASAGSQTESTVRTIHSCTLLREGGYVTIRVRGNGFLYHMVRILSGTLIQVGLGRLDATRMEEILKARDRAAAGPTAPACGLVLVGYHFPALDAVEQCAGGAHRESQRG